MSTFIFEAIEHGRKCPAKTFITSIEHSSYHWHYDYELILVLKGDILVNTSLGHSLLKAGDILLLNSKMVHEIQKSEQDNICLFIQLNQSLFLDYKNINGSFFFYLNSALGKREPANGYGRYKYIAAKISMEFLKESPNMYRINSYIYSLVADFFDYLIFDIYQNPSERNPMEDIELLMSVINYIQENYKEENVLENLYKEYGMSEKTLYRFLKKYIGLSPKTLILNNRINAAKELLRFSGKSISYIASECGFGSENTFYRVFKKEVGVTPSDYKKKDVSIKSDIKIRGYLSFSLNEAVKLLQGMIKEYEDNEI